MNQAQPSFSETTLVKLKDKFWFERQKIAGQCVAACLQHSRQLISSGQPNLTLKMLEQDCAAIIQKFDCTATFHNYKGFPGIICTSVNKQLVHGIPSDYVLQPGDVVKVDLGATYKSAIADAAITVIYGEPKDPEHVKVIDTCKLALDNAIKAVAIGKRLGVIGAAINHVAKSTRYGLVVNYGGHGLDEDQPHAPPFVSNKSQPNIGIRIQPGLTIAIEPLMVIGEPKTKIEKDGWTVTASGICAHFEHTLFVDESQVHIMTA